MRETVLTIILSTISLTITGQRINLLQNSYRKADILEKRQISARSFSLQGENGTWSLKGAELSKKLFKVEHTIEREMLMGVERGSRTYYRQTDNDIKIIGTENVQTLIDYDMPEKWLQFPIQQGDSIGGFFNGTGIYCDRLFMRRFGTYLTKADATGSIVLPTGDTLRHVIRLHTHRNVGIIAAPIDTMKQKIPAFTVDSIVRNLATDTLQTHEDVYRWYAQGYRYPVLEAMVTSLGKEKLSEEVFFCSPESQEQMAPDEENKKIRTREEISGKSESAGTRNSFSYKTVHNDYGMSIHYHLVNPMKVEALLIGHQGYVYQHIRQEGTARPGRIDIDTRHLHQGQYLIYINVNGKSYTEKINVK